MGEKETEKLTQKRPVSEAPDDCRAGLLLVSSGIILANTLQPERSASAIQHGQPPGFTALWLSAAAETCRYELLDTVVAAVELLNVLRPTVAVAWFVTFAALALHDYPECRQRLQDGEDDYLELFVQDVRRFDPFFPVIGGRVAQEFDWRGHHFAKGTWVLLDLYGTNHDARIWEGPDVFRPERFRHWDGRAFSFIPQGGGDHDHGHRCAGEWITIELMKTAIRLLTTAMRYDVPAQDLRIDMSRMPAIPKSRFMIKRVQQTRSSR